MNENVEQIIDAGNVTTQAEQPSVSDNPAEPEPQPNDLALQIGQALLNDPHNTLHYYASQLGYQLVPLQNPALPVQPQQFEQNPSLGPWEQVLAGVVLKMWAGEAAQQVEQMAQQDGIELSDQDISQIFLDALERYQGDVETAYAKFVLPRLRSKQNQPKSTQEQDVESPGDLIAAIHQAGYR
jgi:hypothetical protein